MADKYTIEYRRSLDAEAFWGEQAALIDWEKPSDKVLDGNNTCGYRWFSGGQLNTCYKNPEHLMAFPASLFRLFVVRLQVIRP